MSGRGKKFLALGAAVVLCLIAAAQMGSLFHWKVTCTPAAFAESSRRLSNPDRGFYYIYGYRITDEPVDYATDLRDRTREDDATRLGMMQINLREYRTGAISEEGLSNVRQLFAAMADSDKKWIVRFLYDWNGENEQYEPENLDIILQHMEQVGDVLREYHSCIYTLQGLFIGNWGEMNGTKYTDPDSMRELAACLADVSDASTFLSVRTPAQWRKITGEAAPDGWTENPLAKRLGLFNDGMLGSVSDYGTYSDNTRQDAGDFSAWTREEELAFQDVLCSSVPSGGEVIVDNPYNDLENAIEAAPSANTERGLFLGDKNSVIMGGFDIIQHASDNAKRTQMFAKNASGAIASIAAVTHEDGTREISTDCPMRLSDVQIERLFADSVRLIKFSGAHGNEGLAMRYSPDSGELYLDGRAVHGKADSAGYADTAGSANALGGKAESALSVAFASEAQNAFGLKGMDMIIVKTTHTLPNYGTWKYMYLVATDEKWIDMVIGENAGGTTLTPNYPGYPDAFMDGMAFRSA